jgi:hypothetical protein
MPSPTLLAALALLFALALFQVHRRGRRARQQLAQSIHDHALALDQRCDTLGERLERLEMQRRIDHLALLVDHGERTGRLAPEIAERLRGRALEWRAEAGGD